MARASEFLARARVSERIWLFTLRRMGLVGDESNFSPILVNAGILGLYIGLEIGLGLLKCIR